MNGTLLISKKVYSLAKGKAVTEWIEKPFEVDITEPRDFELRFVNANLKMENLESKFPELSLSWNQRADLKAEAEKMCKKHQGLTDIAWYSDKLRFALVIESHVRMNCITAADSMSALKKILG